jgi:anti-sigma factor RsiW
MPRPSDEMLVAFIDGEVDEPQFTEIADWLDRDPGLRARLILLARATALVHEAFEPNLWTSVPERRAVAFRPKPAERTSRDIGRWWVTMTMAASLACLLFGASIGDIARETETVAIPGGVTPPDLKPWGLVLIGGRRTAAEGQPGSQFTYTTDNAELGPVTLFVTDTADADVEPTFDTRENVNMLYWRHRGHGYYIVGGAGNGWLWNLKNDIGYQLKAL